MTFSCYASADPKAAGVHRHFTSCITNWELGHTKPEVRYIPKIIEFIGYCPYDPTAEPIDRIEMIRRAPGQTQEEFAHILGVDESSLANWVRREHKPGRHSLEILQKFLAVRIDIYSFFGKAGRNLGQHN